MEHAAKSAQNDTDALGKIREHWLSRLAHDFRGPLFAARGYTKLVLDDMEGSVTSNQRRYLESVSESLSRIAALVEAFQDFPSDDKLDLECVNVARVLRTACEEYRQQYPALRIHSSVPAENFVTTADRAKLVPALQGLLTATVEFAGSGGDVRLHAGRDEDELTVRFSGARQNFSQAPKRDFTMWRDIFRLHGGSAHIDDQHEAVFHVTIRLPLVRPAQFFEEGK